MNVGDDMKKDLNRTGVIILIIIFILFYLITSILLDKRNLSKNINIDTNNNNDIVDYNYEYQKDIINNLYRNVKKLYDGVNNRFTVSQDDIIVIGDVIYKKITNFDEVTKNIFTTNGVTKYINTLSEYFAYTDNGYYLAGNLVTYQTYYFRGDNTNIYVTDADKNEIKGIIYERWTANNKNTLATIKVINSNGIWLVDNIDILATE